MFLLVSAVSRGYVPLYWCSLSWLYSYLLVQSPVVTFLLVITCLQTNPQIFKVPAVRVHEHDKGIFVCAATLVTPKFGAWGTARVSYASCLALQSLVTLFKSNCSDSSRCVRFVGGLLTL